MDFYLGTHKPIWLERTTVPLFVSRRVLAGRATRPRAAGRWALDSGGFTELSLYGEWRTTEAEYVADVRIFQHEIGGLEWVAPMDWMCEPHVLERTGLTVYEHQERTVANFRRLRDRLGPLVIPVLQGWTRDEYLACWDEYAEQGVDLEREPLVGLGSVCRRQNMAVAGSIVRALAPLQLHGFGVKLTGLDSYGDVLASADSLAWSFDARRSHPLPGHTHKSCANCMDYALRWRDRVLERLAQERIAV